jgi:hypothetical protein
LRPPARNRSCSISVRYTHQHAYFAVRTGLTVLPEHFDEVAGVVRRSHGDCNLMNAIIDQRKGSIMTAARKLPLLGKEPTVEKVRDMLNGVREPMPLPVQLVVPVLSAPLEAITNGQTTSVEIKANRFQELLTLYARGSVHDAASTKKDKELFARIVFEFWAWCGEKLTYTGMGGAMYTKLAKYFLDERGGCDAGERFRHVTVVFQQDE